MFLRVINSSSIALLLTHMVLSTSLASELSKAGKATSAKDQTSNQAQVPVCGIIESFTGDVELLDASRTKIQDSRFKSPVNCGSWVSVRTGSATLKHRDGFTLKLGPATFLQFLASDSNQKASADQLLLFKGQIFARTSGESGTLRLITANSRAGLNPGSAIFTYNEGQQETQLVAIDGDSYLENRFQPSRPVRARSGEATSLNLALQRVIPTTPRAISVASLKEKLKVFELTDTERRIAIRAAKARQHRKFASTPKADAVRKPASTVLQSDYSRHEISADDEKAQEQWNRRLAAGQEVDDALFFTDGVSSGRSVIKGKIMIEDPLAGVKSKRRKEEEAEKQRLMEELSKLRFQ